MVTGSIPVGTFLNIKNKSYRGVSVAYMIVIHEEVVQLHSLTLKIRDLYHKITHKQYYYNM
jgi:hypothetical protein